MKPEAESETKDTATTEDNDSDQPSPVTDESMLLDPSVLTTSDGMEGGFMMQDDSDYTEYEKRLRLRHRSALHELMRRVVEERGNAASALEYATHIEYRRNQVSLEKEVFQEMVDAL